MTMASSPSPPSSAVSRAQPARAARTVSIACAWRPMWWVSAPQQPTPRATTTSMPRRVSIRIVASLIEGASTVCAQPTSRATRPTRCPSARCTCGACIALAGGMRAGASDSIARMRCDGSPRPGTRPARGRASRAPRSAQRNTAGCGSTRDSTSRMTRSCQGRR